MFTKRISNSANSSFYYGPDALDDLFFIDSYRRSNFSIPEKSLLFAVLADAVETYQQSAFSNSRRKQVLFREAEEWFSSDEADYLFSFKGICEALGFNCAFLRRGLILWTANYQEHRARRPKLQIHSVRTGRRKNRQRSGNLHRLEPAFGPSPAQARQRSHNGGRSRTQRQPSWGFEQFQRVQRLEPG
jgi:hypothetical protein